jgi:chitin deacetylase
MLSLNLILIALDVTYALSHNSVSQTWYHPPDHPVHDLFKRSPNKSMSAEKYPPVGSTGKSI